jgi:putative nucleotidyltransferase with HDIG domain
MHNKIPLLKSLLDTCLSHDHYTHQHSINVSELSMHIGIELGLSDYKITFLHLGGLFHDIGKIALDVNILNKTSKLTEAEYELVKEHTTIGCNILSKIECGYPLELIALQHHERLDGSGYPNNSFDRDIILESQIVTVADITDAMFSDRSYRKALGKELIIQELYNDRGKSLHTDSCDIVINWLQNHR